MGDESINVLAAVGNGALVMYPVRETASGGMFAYGVLSETRSMNRPLNKLRANSEAVVYPTDADDKEAVHVPYGNLVGVGLYSSRYLSDSSDEDDCSPMDETHPTGGLEVYCDTGHAPKYYGFRQLYCSRNDRKLCIYHDTNMTMRLKKKLETLVLLQLSRKKTFPGIKCPQEPLLHRIATLFEGCYKSRETEEDDNAEWSGDESEQDGSEEDGSEEDGSEEDGSESESEQDEGESEAEDGGSQEDRSEGENGDENEAGGDRRVANLGAATRLAFEHMTRQVRKSQRAKQEAERTAQEAQEAQESINGTGGQSGDENHMESPHEERVSASDGNEPEKKRKKCDTEPTIHVDEESPSKKARSSTMYLAVAVTSGSCVIQTDRLLGEDETNTNGRIECDREMFSRIQEILGRYKDKEIPCAKDTKMLHVHYAAFLKNYPSYSVTAELKQVAKKATLVIEQRENARKKWKKNIGEAKKKSEGKLYETIAPFLDCCGRQNAGFAVAPSELEHARAQMERGQKYGAKELLRALQSVTK